MNYFIYHLDEHKYINRFITTGTYKKNQQFEKSVLRGRINEWLEKGFSIHENPCRQEFIKARTEKMPEYIDVSQYSIHEQVEVFGEKRELSVYYPFGNAGVDDSEFYSNPTYLRSYHYTYLFSDHNCKAQFRLETCGGASVWVNDSLVTDFIPFTRNMVKKQIVSIELKQGLNKLVVCLDDLAERDTDYYFRVLYMGYENLRICLPVDDETDVEALYRVEKMLADVSFDKEVYISEPVELCIHNPLDQELDIRITYKPVADMIAHGERLNIRKSYILRSGEKKLKLFSADDVIPGFYYVQVEACLSGIWVGRKIATQIFHSKLLEAKDTDIKERKLEALRYLQETEVDNVYKAAAILKLHGDCHKAEGILLDQLEGIESRKDCSDFHLIAILQIIKLFGSELSSEIKSAIRELILGFRYWIDEPGDDVMWFFSENHALLFHVCQYVTGTMYQDEVFISSGLTGAQAAQKADGLLDEWFEEFFREYITEWNSNAYIPVDVLGLCGLYNLSEEGSKWRENAKKALDHIFYDLAVNEHKGTIMTTFGRSYEKESKGNYNAGTTSLLYIAYGCGYLNRASLAYISFILGDYIPPEKYKNYIGLSGNQALVYRKTQGFNKHVNLYMYKDSKAQLSTAVEFHPFTPGYQEHIMQATLDPTAQVFINHPGEVQPYGNGRPNYWSGNGSLPRAVQYQDIGIMQYHIPEDHPVGFTHAYIPLMEFQSYLGADHLVAAEKDGGYIGVKSLNSLRMQTVGPCKYREFISDGRDNVWVVKVGRKEEYHTLREFRDHMDQISILCTEDGAVEVSGMGYEKIVLGSNGCQVYGRDAYDYPLTANGTIEIFKKEPGDAE